MDSHFFSDMVLYLYLFCFFGYFFVFGCLGHDFLEGLSLHSLHVPFQ